MVQVLFLARFWGEPVRRRLAEMPEVDLRVVDDFDDLIAGLPDAEVLIIPDLHDGEARALAVALQAAPNVRWIHSVSAGNEGLIGAGLPGVRLLTHSEGAAAPTIAEYVLGMFVALARQFPILLQNMAERRWQRPPALPMALEGRTLLIVGLGHIGRAIAARAAAFGMTVIAVTRTPRPDPSVSEVHPLADLPSLLPRADAIAVAIALGPQTRHLIGAREFARCKPGALLVNVARGAVVDTEALRKALISGRIGGAGLDVTDPEPLPPDHPLWEAPHLIISPHMSAMGSPLTEQRLASGIAENLERYLKGEIPAGVIAA
jgi:phosphoglycerate dehydrogenase-like enzyme